MKYAKNETEKAQSVQLWALWRSGWDSNPRALADNLISSQARYDHFDTAPDGDRAKLYPVPDIIPAAVEKIKQFIQIIG